MLKRTPIATAALIIILSGCAWFNQPQNQEGTSGAKEQENAAPETVSDTVTLAPESVALAGIKTEPVSLRPMDVEYTFSGSVSVNETRLAHVASRISGRAVEVYANLGDSVKKGQALALIDSPELGEAQSHFLKVQSNFQVALQSYERAKMLLEGKVISTGEFQRREGEYLSAQADAKAAEDRLHLFGMTDAQISAIANTHTIHSTVSIYSPLGGNLMERHLTMGEVVEPAKTLFSITDLSRLWVMADVPERDIPKIKKGQRVSVSVSPYPGDVFHGAVGYIAVTIDPATRTVKVRVEVENHAGKLKPEMFAAVRITSEATRNVLAVPASALQLFGQKSAVFVAKSGTVFEKRDVPVGPEVNGFHQIISGLSEGEQVVAKGSFTLKSEILKGMMAED